MSVAQPPTAPCGTAQERQVRRRRAWSTFDRAWTRRCASSSRTRSPRRAARDANAAISRVPQAARGGDPGDDEAPAVRSYEIILTAFEGFARDLLPKLVYHLESIGAHLPACRGVVISAFAGERLYFVDAEKFVARACRILGVTAEELVRRHGTGEQRTAVRPSRCSCPAPRATLDPSFRIGAHCRAHPDDAMRRIALASLLFAVPALAAAPSREPFGNARVTLMVRVQAGGAEPRLAELDVWAEGTRLRARVRGEPASGDLWVDGSGSPLWIVDGKVEAPSAGRWRRRCNSPSVSRRAPAHANTDRIAGHPCKIVTETLSASGDDHPMPLARLAPVRGAAGEGVFLQRRGDAGGRGGRFPRTYSHPQVRPPPRNP